MPRLKTHEEFSNEIKNKLPNVVLLNEYKGSETIMHCICDKGHCWDRKAANLLHSSKGCPICDNSWMKNGESSFNNKNPNLKQFLFNQKDGDEHTYHSRFKLKLKCPNCGNIQWKTCSDFTKSGYFICSACDKNTSYPNRFIRAFFKVLDIIEYEQIDFEWGPKWAKGRRYDVHFDFNGISYVIEMDGRQHFENNGWRNLKEQTEIDQEKNLLAEENNCIMIRIDSRVSRKEYIVDNIKNSLLSKVFNLDNFDWEKCNNLAQTNNLKEICEKFNLEEFNLFDDSLKRISEKYKVAPSTIKTYLWQGKELNWLSKKSLLKLEKNKKLIDIYDINNNFIVTLKNVAECERWVKKEQGTTNVKKINECLNGKRSSYKNYIFKYHNPEDNSNKNNQK